MSTVSERSWNSSDDYEDDNSINRSSVSRRISLDLDLPGGVITTHCVSTVIRPGSKQTHDPLQFVKIQSTELSKKAVEQIRLAEEVKITKEKIKEVEEEWQNNLLNWKSKRRQSRLTGGEESDSGDNQQRKVKTFSEILNEKAKSGHRIGYNLHKYIGIQDEEEEESLVLANNNTNNNNHKQGTGSSRVSNANNNLGDYHEDDESNQLKSYEHQQAELQKKRQELNNKLQELEQLEKKQNELERQERVSTSEVISSSSSSSSSSPSPTTMATTKTTSSSSSSSSATLISPTVIVSIKNEESSINPSAGKVNSRNSDEIKQKQNDNFREKKVFNRNSSTDLSRRDQSSGESQPKTVTINENNRQKSVWNYLLQQQDDPRVVNHSHLSNQNIDPNQHHPSNRSNGRFNQLDSESEDDDHLNDSIYADEDAEKEQMLSFRAKLSTFESLSKCKPAPTQQQQQQNNHNNHNQHHHHQQQQQQQQQTITSKPIRKSEKVKKTADQLTSRLFPSAASSLSSSLSLSSSSSSSSSVTLANNNNPSPSSSLSSSSTATPRTTTTTTTGIPSTTVIMTNQNNNKEYENSVLMKNNRPPTAEDLAYKEEMKVFQQRLQNQNLADQQKHLLYASQSPLQANSFNTQQQQQQQHQHQHATLQHHHSHPQLHTFQQPLQQTQPLPRQLQQSATQLHHHQFQQQSSHQKQPNLIMLSSSQQTQPQQSSPYNINHWVIQEAELRRLHYTQQPQPQLQPQPQPQQTSPYNINHWVVQEAELRRLHHAQQQQQSTGPALMARSTSINRFPQSSQINPNISTNSNTYENHVYENSPFRGSHASGLNRIQNVAGADTTSLMKKSNGLQGIQPQPPPMQPLAQVQVQQQLPLSQPQQLHQLQSQGPLQLAQPLQSQQLLQSQQQLLQAQQQKQMLSVSGKKKCSNCGDELGRGCAAMVIETLALYYHINCFRCSVCHIQLGNGTCGTDVRVRNHKLHCHNCYSNDEAGLKFSRV